MWMTASLLNLVTKGRKFGHIPGERGHCGLRQSLRRRSWRLHAPHPPLHIRRPPTAVPHPKKGKQHPRSGTDPDNRKRNRDAQTERAHNGEGEFGEQASLGSYIR